MHGFSWIIPVNDNMLELRVFEWYGKKQAAQCPRWIDQALVVHANWIQRSVGCRVAYHSSSDALTQTTLRHYFDLHWKCESFPLHILFTYNNVLCFTTFYGVITDHREWTVCSQTCRAPWHEKSSSLPDDFVDLVGLYGLGSCFLSLW